MLDFDKLQKEGVRIDSLVIFEHEDYMKHARMDDGTESSYAACALVIVQ